MLAVVRPISRFPLIAIALVFLWVTFDGAAAVNPPAISFVRTDMPPWAAIFDSVHKVVYVSVPDLGEVVVISTAQHTVAARIAVPWARGLDLSPDGTRLVVGSGSSVLGGPATSFLTLIDT